jgi:hypothetical protein
MEASMAYSKDIAPVAVWRDGENPRNASVRLVCLQTEVRGRDLTSKKQDR